MLKILYDETKKKSKKKKHYSPNRTNIMKLEHLGRNLVKKSRMDQDSKRDNTYS
jgi:hypothetical protein